jgi:hypothetical protein
VVGSRLMARLVRCPGALTLPLLAALATSLPGCPAWTLFAPGGAPALAEGGSCTSSWECADRLTCTCGTCLPAGATAACEAFPDAGPPGCSGTPPVCFEGCGNLTQVGVARCGPAGWVCGQGVRFDACPAGTCWGEPRPGEVCAGGEWTCEHGRSPTSGACHTPGGCRQADGGTTAPPGCRYSPSCTGTATSCGPAWCALGMTEPATCLAHTWQCERGVLASWCPPSCPGDTPVCLVACGDARPLGTATCTAAGWSCGVGVLEASCPPGTCWGPRPAGATGCSDGGWLCGDGGNAPGGGCLTPGGCADAGPVPGCYADVCCTGQPLPAWCVGWAWSCGNQFSSTDCQSNPVCNFHPDAGTRDAGAPDAVAP